MNTIGVIIAVVFVVACIALALLSSRRYRQIEAEEKERAAGLDAPDMDEGFAHQIAPAPSIEQAARDKGAI